jgi:hypothetical protein
MLFSTNGGKWTGRLHYRGLLQRAPLPATRIHGRVPLIGMLIPSPSLLAHSRINGIATIATVMLASHVETSSLASVRWGSFTSSPSDTSEMVFGVRKVCHLTSSVIYDSA